MKKTQITPSILNANFLYLDQELQRLAKIKLKRIHYDVMDYDFVPNLTFGPKILSDIKNKYQDFYVDIHFMVKIKTKDLKQFFLPFVATKPQMMTVHVEALSPHQIKSFLELCRHWGIKSSLAIKPKTTLEEIDPYLDWVDNVLVMTVEPGFGGQKIIPATLQKIQALNRLRKNNNYQFTIEVDGGINAENIGQVIAFGADDIVVGSYLFESKDLKKAYDTLQK